MGRAISRGCSDVSRGIKHGRRIGSGTANAVLIDEKEGRQRAALLDLRTIGVIGVLITIGVIGVLIVAKQAGRLKSLAAEIGKLRREAGFFVGGRLEAQALAMVGE